MEQIQEIIRGNRIRFLDLKYPDIVGRLRHVTMPIERLEQVMRDGVGFDSSSVAGFRPVEEGDMVLKPDPGTAIVDPFAARPTLSCLATIHDPTTGDQYERDPRGILRRALDVLLEVAGADGLMVRPEFEFYLFNSARFHTGASSAGYEIDTDELSHDDQTGLTLHKGSAYHVAPPFDRSSDFRSELSELMAGCGIPVKYHHHEGGRYSQVEVEPRFMPAPQAADGIMLTKYLVRNLAFRNGKSATFMPKPILGEPGCGMHLHMYLTSGETAGMPNGECRSANSAFGTEDMQDSSCLSQLGCHFTGGILEHAPSLCAFTNSSTNSYRRLVPGYEAPTLVFFSVGNRNAAIRIPGYITSAAEMAIEYRIPDATGNPYLALAAIVLAAADGVRRKLDPGKPFQGTLAEATAKYGPNGLPRSLPEALAALKRDNEYLCRDDVFPRGLLDFWDSYKYAEAEAIMLRPHPWEYSLYYGC